MIMKKIITFLAILIGFQGLTQDTLKIITLERALVTSVRADKKTPITQKTIGDTSIQETYQGQEIPMLLGSQPSINSNSDGGHPFGYSYFSLRGASQSRINMTLNGVPLNEPEDHGVYTSNYPSFINSIQSIQIQRGVGTSSNGAASFIGSINFQTKNGLKKATDIQLGAGAFNTLRFNASTASGLNKNNIAYVVNIGGIRTDGFRENSGSVGGSVFTSLGYFGNKRITKVVFFSGQSKNKMAWDGSDESVLKTNFRDNPRGLDNTDLFTQSHIQLHNVNMFSKKFKLTTTVFYNHLRGHYDVYSMKDISAIGYYAAEKQSSNWFGYINQFDYKSRTTNLSVGVSLNTYKRNHNGVKYYDSTTSLEYSNHGVKNEASGFVKVNFGDDVVRFYADLQGRYIDFKYLGDVPMNKQSWFFINPKIGLKIFFNKDIDVYSSLAISHREPTRSVLFGGGFYLTTLNLIKPEEVIDFELGTNYKTDRLRLQSNIFYMAFRNEIIPAGPIGSNSLPTMINVDKSKRYGLEVDAQYALSDRVSYDGNLTLSRSQFGDQKNEQLFSPRVMFNQSITLEYRELSLGVNQTVFSKSYIDITNTNSMAGYFVYGVNVSYEKNNYRVSIQANNITDKKYYSNGYVANGVRYLYPNALASYYVTVKIRL